jgi:hypothetical protein
MTCEEFDRLLAAARERVAREKEAIANGDPLPPRPVVLGTIEPEEWSA